MDIHLVESHDVPSMPTKQTRRPTLPLKAQALLQVAESAAYARSMGAAEADILSAASRDSAK